MITKDASDLKHLKTKNVFDRTYFKSQRSIRPKWLQYQWDIRHNTFERNVGIRPKTFECQRGKNKGNSWIPLFESYKPIEHGLQTKTDVNSSTIRGKQRQNRNTDKYLTKTQNTLIFRKYKTSNFWVSRKYKTFNV